MSNIDKIKTKIKERLALAEKCANDACEKNLHSTLEANELLIRQYKSLLADIDSISEESNKSLEEAAKESLEEQDVAELFCGSYDADQMLEMFKSGSEWRYQKDRREFAKLKAKEWSDGYDEGIAKGKELMMKDAVEGEVIYDLGGFFRIKSEAIDGAKYKVGSWVKLIIVKED